MHEWTSAYDQNSTQLPHSPLEMNDSASSLSEIVESQLERQWKCQYDKDCFASSRTHRLVLQAYWLTDVYEINPLGKLGRAFWDGTQMVQVILRRERFM